MEDLGINQSELARRVGVTQGAIAKIVKNNPNGSSHLHAIARELKTSAGYLLGETDDPEDHAPPAPTREQMAHLLGLVSVASIDLAYGMGATFAGDLVDVDHKYFDAEWLATITDTPPASLTWARGRGDSMSPTINDHDIVLIDRSDRNVRDQDAIWAFTIGDMAYLKRLRVRGEKVTILSDNERVPPDYAHPDEINIVGKVSHIVRRI
jgi:phage repressor protein C with HTH and peptisase S24 domain